MKEGKREREMETKRKETKDLKRGGTTGPGMMKMALQAFGVSLRQNEGP